MIDKKEPCGLHCLKIKNISVTIGGQNILQDVNLHLHCGKLSAIIGKNGGGKSTLVKAILGEVSYSGFIEFKDKEEGEQQKLKIGYVPQYLNLDKNAPMSVYDFIASYISKTPVFLKKNKKTIQVIRRYLSYFEAEELVDHQLSTLSGGELQRVLLTLSIIGMPNLLILDEPISGIDQKGMELFYKNIDYLKNNFDLAVILVSHDLEYVARYADEVILLDCKVLCQGSASEVYASKEFQQTFGSASYRVEAV